MQPSPYDTPQSQIADSQSSPAPLAAGPPPSAIKVFGILHLIVAGWGVLGGFWTVLTVMFFGDFIAWMNRATGGKQPDAAQQAQVEYMREIAWLTWLQLAFSVVLIVLLIMAGIHLLKQRDRGRQLSVRYAWLSIGSKIVSMGLMVVFALPAAARMNEAMVGSMPGNTGDVMGAVTTVSSVIGMASTMIYPILVLAIVNGQKVRDFLAGR